MNLKLAIVLITFTFLYDKCTCVKTKTDIDAVMFDIIWAGIKSLRKEDERLRIKGGATYVQWGRSKCSGKNAELIYSGYVGGSSYATMGAGNNLCLPKEPQWGIYNNKVSSNPFIGGTAFDIQGGLNIPNTLFDAKHTSYGVSCAVCQAPKVISTIMIPGRKECFGDWEREYTGYLFAGHPGNKSGSEYICVDGNPDYLRKVSNWKDKAILYPVHAKCNGALPCPPYVNGREMTCIVCSK